MKIWISNTIAIAALTILAFWMPWWFAILGWIIAFILSFFLYLLESALARILKDYPHGGK